MDERILEDTFSADLDWEAISRMGMREIQVSDDERNAMRHPLTRIVVANVEAAATVAEVAAEAYEGDDEEDDDRMYMDVDAIPPPSPQHSTGAGPSRASHSAGPSRPPPDDMMGLLREIWEAQRATDQWVVDLAASLRVT